MSVPLNWLSDQGGIGGEPPPPRWLLRRGGKGVLRLGKTGMLTAAGGVGKSAMLCGLALSVASGEPWLGVLDVPEPGPVLLVMGEEDSEEMQRRLYWTARSMEISSESIAIAERRIVALPMAGRPCALLEGGEGEQRDSGFLRTLRSRASETCDDWRLVVLDPLSRFSGAGAESSNEGATRFVQAVESVAQLPGSPSVIVAHHTTKGSRGEDSKGRTRRVDGNSPRGASALVDGFRWVATVAEKEPRVLEMRVTKSNYAPKGPPLLLERVRGGALVARGGEGDFG